MIFRGLQKTTLIDYPGHIAATLFVDKCNFRCPYCQNPQLVFEETGEKITEKEVLEFLKKRKKYLEGICITGGEPTLHPELNYFARRVKDLGLKVKVDTNGTNPKMLRELIEENLVDYVSMDVKAPLEKYEKAVRVHADTNAIKESIELLKESRVNYEFRLTVVPTITQMEDIEKIGKLVKGAKLFVLQQFENDVPLVDEKFQKIKPYSKKKLEEMKKVMEKFVEKVKVKA